MAEPQPGSATLATPEGVTTAPGAIAWKSIDGLLLGIGAVLVLAYLSLILVVERLDQASFLFILLACAIVLARGRVRLPPERAEKAVVLALLVFLAANTLVLLAGPINSDGIKIIGKLIRLPLAILPLLAFRRTDLRGIVWLGSTVGALLALGIALDQVLLRDLHRAGGHTNPILFGNIGLTLGFISAATSRLGPGPRWPRLLLSTLALVAGIGVSLLSGTRGGWLAIPLFLIILVYANREIILRHRRVASVLAALALVVGVIGLDQAQVAQRVQSAGVEVQRYFDGEANTKRSSVGIRLDLWRASWRGFAENPLLGVGWGGMERHFASLAKADPSYRVIGRYGHAHSQYFSSLLCGGLVGLGALLYLLYAAARLFLQALAASDARRRALGAAGLMVVVGFAVFGLTEAIFLRAMPAAFFGLTLAVIGSQLRLPGSGSNGTSPAAD